LLALPLLALTATGQTVNQARESGALELLFSHPFSREGYYLAVTLSRFGVLVAPLLALVAAMALYGRFVQGEAVPWAFALRATLVSASLLWAFTGLGLMVSTLVANQAKALMLALLLWAAGVALLDFALVGAMLQWRLNPAGVFILAALNPVEAARMALLSAAEPELSVLGPVGFYLANRVGPDALLALGVLWPTAVGALAWGAGFRAFRKGDLV
ncbi:MAG: ABC transporter permease subunit, partial [Candidatus Methylomirabilis sp.]|nr:ABC transporter permease subunit [Deltaproteobacteria bacterium]